MIPNNKNVSALMDLHLDWPTNVSNANPGTSPLMAIVLLVQLMLLPVIILVFVKMDLCNCQMEIAGQSVLIYKFIIRQLLNANV